MEARPEGVIIDDLCADKHLSRLRCPNWFVKAPGHVLTLRKTFSKHEASLGKMNKRNLSDTQRIGFLNFIMKSERVYLCVCECVFSMKTFLQKSEPS